MVAFVEYDQTESIAEAVIVSFLVKPGEMVEADQDILEVETNKATLNVASPCRGKLQNFVVKLTESYPVGVVLGYLEASAEDVARLGLDAPSPEANGKDTDEHCFRWVYGGQALRDVHTVRGEGHSDYRSPPGTVGLKGIGEVETFFLDAPLV